MNIIGNLRRKVGLFILCACFLICLTPSYISAYDTVTIKVYLDSKYIQYEGNPGSISTIMGYVNYPFQYYWGEKLTPTYLAENSMPASNCQLSYAACCSNTCSTNCTNTYPCTSTYHHKNIYYNYLYMCTWNPAGSYDLVMGNTICKVCYNADGIGHTDNCPGLGAVTGDHTFAMYYRTSTIPSGLDVDIYNTRLRQHEISHNYGCEDGGCMYNSPCIMKGSYDTVDVYDSLQLWCADCHFDFNPNIQ